MSDLEILRNRIDEIDKELVAIFEKRMETVLQIAQYKKKNNLEIFNKARELEVIRKNVSRLENKGFKEVAENFLNKVMEISRNIQKEYIRGEDSFTQENGQGIEDDLMVIRVGYQGEPGSFSEEALIQHFGDKVNKYNAREFQDIFEALKNYEIDYGVLPIENSSTGGIAEVYDLLRKYGFYIVGERCIKVEHNLASVKDAKLEDIKEVYSHPQAFQQCSEFFKDYPNLRLIPFKNTAISAKYINEEKSKIKAAVCSRKAAEIYDLEIIKENINYNKCNYTRFIIIGRDLEIKKECNKISIVTTISHIPGALYKILGFFAKNNLNMMKIESRPIIDKSWEYFFYIDFSGNLNDEAVKKSIEAIKETSSYFQLLGNYVGHN
ncbi:prephenate dehydratase [Paramaledivibacter caminithermalis]|jgi:chorismate mutase/prephenate dehydratase|uniref:Bifunctional chorismate mutase/prephenate dehydratase n=1 Tax=Paramaledivibacter caminithermalis (strain DSM 15212 / CIP 107654 / DViRD3) TaxID=1121301 RepID=A0A1M6PL82_PARC5|nr:prephenate dehydratase [Paramaledivibacter caminithermalis]SHK08732.1 chorismate mutase [Paramaledivibacter caminithermalis DSM 15212]